MKIPTHGLQEHISKMRHDGECVDFLSKDNTFCDWVVVCQFYSIVHCIEAYAHKIKKEKELLPISITDRESIHQKREKFVNKYLNMHFTSYMKLYQCSRKCRYDPTYFTKLKELKQMKIYQENLIKVTNKLKDVLK